MAHRIPNEEWLHLAKVVPVGQQRRHIHLREGRDNMIVGNRDDRWWAYCQSCKAGAVEMKSHVLLMPREPVESRVMTIPDDAEYIPNLFGYQRDFVAMFLARKHMDLTYLPGLTRWSESRHRLYVPTRSGMMARDTSEKSGAKWLTMTGQQWLDHECAGRFNAACLVEDTFSFFKVQHVASKHNLPVTVYCSLGTKMHTALFLRCLQSHTAVSSFYDGDGAGWVGAAENSVRLVGAGIGSGLSPAVTCATRGLDPKDMVEDDIRAHLETLIGPY